MDRTDTAATVGIPLGIATATTALLKWTSLPKWAAIFGGIIGGVFVGLIYAILIFAVIGLLPSQTEKGKQ